MKYDVQKFIKILLNKSALRKYSSIEKVNLATTLFHLELGGGRKRNMEKCQGKTFPRNKEQLKEYSFQVSLRI